MVRVYYLLIFCLTSLQSHARGPDGLMRPLCEQFAATKRTGYSPTQKKIVTYNKWIDGDTARWNERYIPEFKDIIEKAKGEAVRNQTFKTSFVKTATIEYSRAEVDRQNMTRLQAECGNTTDSLFGCTHFQADCSMQMSNVVLTDALNSFSHCALQQKDYCGKSFQTPEGVKGNLASLEKAFLDIQKLKSDIEKDPALSEYFGDVEKAFSVLHDAYEKALEAKKKALQNFKEFEKDLEEMNKLRSGVISDFDQKAKDQYNRNYATNENFRKACDVLNKCDDYLEDKGFPDTHSVISQINICQVDPGKVGAKELKEFKEVMLHLEESNDRKNLKDVAVNALENSIALTVTEFANTYKALIGKVPTQSEICKNLGASVCKHHKAVSTLKGLGDLPNVPKMNMRGEIDQYNKAAEKLNELCKQVAKTPDVRRLEAPIQQQLTQIMYNTRVGQLMGFEKFRKEIPPFDQEACFAKGKGMNPIPNTDAGVQLLTKATSGILDLQKDKGKQIQDQLSRLGQLAYHGKYLDPKDADYEKLLRSLLENDPFTVREAIRASGSPDQALWLCHATADIYRREKNERVWKWIGTGVCIAGSLAATVFTAGAAAPLLIGSIAMGAGVGVYSLDQALTRQHNKSMSAAINSSDPIINSYALQAADDEEKAAYVEIGLSLLPVALKGAQLGGKVVSPLIAKTPMVANGLEAGAVGYAKLGNAGKAIVDALKKGQKVTTEMLQRGLGEKLGNAGGKGMQLVGDFLRGAAPDAALEFMTAVAIHPDPLSESSIQSMLMGVGFGASMRLGGKGLHWLKQNAKAKFDVAKAQVDLPATNHHSVTTKDSPSINKGDPASKTTETPIANVQTTVNQKVVNPSDALVVTSATKTGVGRKIRSAQDAPPQVSDNVTSSNKHTVAPVTGDAIGSKKIPLSADDYSKEYSAYKVYDEKFPVLGHIKGDFKYLDADGVVPQAKIEGGVHTFESVDFFKKIRPDIADQISIKEMPNGVMVAEIPESGFFKYRFDRMAKKNIVTKNINGEEIRFTHKGLFPKKWSDDDILKAINSVKSGDASFTQVRKDVQVIQGMHEGIPIEVIVKEGKVQSAYPLTTTPDALSPASGLQVRKNNPDPTANKHRPINLTGNGNAGTGNGNPGMGSGNSAHPKTHDYSKIRSENMHQSEILKDALSAFKPGEVVSFSDGKKIKVKKYLGGGSSTAIYELDNGQVIRINKRTNMEGMASVDDYRKGYNELKDSGLPIVKVLDTHGTSAEYVMVEKLTLKKDFNFRNAYTVAVKDPNDPEVAALLKEWNMSQNEVRATVDKFSVFVKKSAKFEHLDQDFHSEQIVFDHSRNEWVLADYGSGNKLYSGTGSKTIFDGSDWKKLLGDRNHQSTIDVVNGERK